ncbi:MAG TPA: hypothetical protein VK480_10355 [Solirubrobacterales bacterium]|nr:hypothetical protein [Solirubrobacterales bacterium]
MRSERGQGTVEWVGTLFVVSLLMLGLVAAGVRVPGATLARAVADRLLCAAALADGCGDEPTLIAAYGTEVGELVRRHAPKLAFETGSRALPVDFRRCRSSECGDGSARGLVHRTDEGLPVTAFVHVVDCREGKEANGADCSGERAGNLYVQLWLYYADSATLRGVPVAGKKGYHHDDWESVQFRFRPDGQVDQRASSHHGYNSMRSVRNWGSDAGLAPHDGWGPETGLLLVSGGSHAGNTIGFADVDRFVPGRRLHFIPLEQIATTDTTPFAVSPPWLKQVWLNPEAEGTS